MKHSKRTRLSQLKSRFEGSTPSIQSAPGEVELLHTSLQEEFRRSEELRRSIQRLQGLLEKQNELHSDLKSRLRDLADCEQIPKFRLLVNPLVFASEKVREDVRKFALKIENSSILANEQSRESCRDVEEKITAMRSLIEHTNLSQQNLTGFQLRCAQQRATLLTRITLEELRLASAQKQRQRLTDEFHCADAQLQKAQRSYDQTCRAKLDLEGETTELHLSIASYNEQIMLLEEGATNQNELARRMVQMELLQNQLHQLSARYQQELKRRGILSKQQ